jgi:hypothetical protein
LQLPRHNLAVQPAGGPNLPTRFWDGWPSLSRSLRRLGQFGQGSAEALPPRLNARPLDYARDDSE